eukprot:2900649-Rhodomonas_salina.1
MAEGERTLALLLCCSLLVQRVQDLAVRLLSQLPLRHGVFLGARLCRLRRAQLILVHHQRSAMPMLLRISVLLVFCPVVVCTSVLCSRVRISSFSSRRC